MQNKYPEIIEQNIKILFNDHLPSRAEAMKAEFEDPALVFNAFGARCRLAADGVWLNGEQQTGPKGIILSLYALHAISKNCRIEPFKAFKTSVFLPLDALADTGEYTSRAIFDFIASKD